MGESSSQPGFEKYRFDDVQLGSGANGVTYRVRHKHLDLDQVVKLYFPRGPEGFDSHGRGQLEARKNAEASLSNAIAVVHDAGVYSYPTMISYSCMESVEGVFTLSEWVNSRRTFLMRAKAEHPELLVAARADALNVGMGFLKTVLEVFTKGITHGDLNPHNILVYEDALGHQDFADRYQEITRNGTIGRLSASRLKLIDMGSSRLAGTNADVGTMRDAWFVVDNMRKILFPWFDIGGSLKQWLRCSMVEKEGGLKAIFVDAEATDSDSQPGDCFAVNSADIASELVRLLLVLNVALGYGHNLAIDNGGPGISGKRWNPSPNRQILDSSAMSFLNGIIESAKPGVADDVFAPDAQATVELMTYEPCGRLIKWPAVWGSLAARYPELSLYEAVHDDTASPYRLRLKPACAKVFED
ncbi:MAG: hypothetical protein L0G59_10465 [Kocuria sp.]|nr:hypothetical protein [Kocuria sp.]